MNIKLIFSLMIVLSSIAFSQNNKSVSNDFLNTILLDEVGRLYPIGEVDDSAYSISVSFDFNYYRLNQPIMMEISIYAKKGSVTFTNSSTVFDNYRFNIYDANNKKVEMSDNYTLWTYRDITIESTNEVASIVTLREGESFSYKIDLNNWFNFESQGQYKIEGMFNPLPILSRNFYVKIDTGNFYLDKANAGAPPIITQSIDNVVQEDYIVPSTKPPYDIINDTLRSMQDRDWDNYFKNMYLPSIINISVRYRDKIRENYNDMNLDDFTTDGLAQTVKRSSLSSFLATQFNDTLSIPLMQSNFGSNFVIGLESAFSDNTIRSLALKFEILYRTAIPEDRKQLFDEFKNYIVSSYDRDVRIAFIDDIRKKSMESNSDSEYYKQFLTLMLNEYEFDTTYTLLNYEIVKTVIKEEYGLQTATVETRLYQRFFNFETGNIYQPTINRVFVLRKMGAYWYVVNYYDFIDRSRY